MDMVMELASGRQVIVFSKTGCCMSHTIIAHIRSFGVNPEVYELDKLPNGAQIDKELIRPGCRPSLPAVFIGKEFVGGANEIMSLNLKGQLKPLLLK